MTRISPRSASAAIRHDRAIQSQSERRERHLQGNDAGQRLPELISRRHHGYVPSPQSAYAANADMNADQRHCVQHASATGPWQSTGPASTSRLRRAIRITFTRRSSPYQTQSSCGCGKQRLPARRLAHDRWRHDLDADSRFDRRLTHGLQPGSAAAIILKTGTTRASRSIQTIPTARSSIRLKSGFGKTETRRGTI